MAVVVCTQHSEKRVAGPWGGGSGVARRWLAQGWWLGQGGGHSGNETFHLHSHNALIWAPKLGYTLSLKVAFTAGAVRGGGGAGFRIAGFWILDSGFRTPYSVFRNPHSVFRMAELKLTETCK